MEFGSWNICRHQHRHGQCKTKYCGRAAPAVATLMLPSQVGVVGHLLIAGMNPLRGRKLPACLHAKRDTTARKPEHAAYPAQMLKLRRTHEFPEIVVIERCTPICGMATSRPSTAGPFLNPDLEAAWADQRPALQALPGAGFGRPETADRSRPRIAEDRSAAGSRPRRRPEPARDRGRPVRTESARHRNPWSLRAAGGHGRHTRTAGQMGHAPPPPRTANQHEAGFEPSPNSCRGPAALTQRGSGYPGPASPSGRAGEHRRLA